MQEKLDRLSQNKDKEEELQKLARDGKLDKEERAKMTKEDKEKWGKLSGHKKDESKDKDKKDEPKK